MKYFILVFLLCFVTYNRAIGDDSTQDDYCITLYEDEGNEDSDRDNKGEYDPIGRRSLQWSTVCLIRPTVIVIQNIEKADILCYEILDSQNCLIGSFDQETDFLSCLYMMNGKLKIRIILDSFSLSGYCEII